MNGYQEPDINFPPNYNDTSNKKRAASWRGRILININNG
jgi:hypothetical protein